MKLNSLLFALLLGVGTASSLFSQVLLFDFNNAGDTPTHGGTWNVLLDNAGTFSGFVYADGTAATGISLTLTNWTNSTLDQGNGWNGGNNKDWVDYRAAADYFFNTSGTGTITFSGLDQSLPHNISYLGARSTTTGRDTNVRVNGEFTLNEVDSREYNTFSDGWVDAAILNWTSVTPNSSGEIVITVESLNEYRHVNAIRLEIIPEPSTVALFGGGLIAFTVMRLRRGRRPSVG